jgi:hypothetical protein
MSLYAEVINEFCTAGVISDVGNQIANPGYSIEPPNTFQLFFF